MSTMKTRVQRGPRVPEKVVQSHIVQALRSVGGQVYVMGTTRRRGDYGGTMQTEGIPDLMAFLPRPRSVADGPRSMMALAAESQRRLLFVECKAAGGQLRPEQVVFRDLCGEADVTHLVGGLDDVLAWLTDAGYIKAENVPHYRQPGAPR